MLPVSLAALSWCGLPESIASYTLEIKLAELPSVAQSGILSAAFLSGLPRFQYGLFHIWSVSLSVELGAA